MNAKMVGFGRVDLRSSAENALQFIGEMRGDKKI